MTGIDKLPTSSRLPIFYSNMLYYSMAKSKLATFTLSGKLLKELRKMAKRDGMPVTEVLKLAIRDRKYFDDKTRGGATIRMFGNQPPAEGK